jgi:hypothetical protein
MFFNLIFTVSISGNFKKRKERAHKGKDYSVVLRVFQLACIKLNKEKAVCNSLDTVFSMKL